MATSRPIPGILGIGGRVLELVGAVGDFALFSLEMITWMLTRRTYAGTLLPAMYQVGVRSIPVVAITGTFIGMVLAVQAHDQFRARGLESRLGSVINTSLVTELGPVLAATMLAGRIGGAMAAEIGTLKVTEQIDALRCLGTNPIHYLVVPRFLACTLFIPLLTVMADFMGVNGGALVSTRILHVDHYHYWKYTAEGVGLWQLFCGIFKSIFFGAEIAVISCFAGFYSTGGAEGVGRAATLAFVYSFIAILGCDFLLGILLSAVYMQLWPEASGLLGGNG